MRSRRRGEGARTEDLRRRCARCARDLARAMVADGEGATKTIAMHVTGADNVAQARTIARAIVNSNLVKTALFGEDPNWGRIVAAAGSGAREHGSATLVTLDQQ